jgi:mRNA-degrading endonuclease RelE of RelBE toxin-antitoxin system
LININIKIVNSFKKDFKKLAKKYKKIDEDIRKVILELKVNPKLGILLHNNCYKIRVPNSSTTTGKSGGFRIIYYFIDEQNNIYFMSMYSKSDQVSISDSKLVELLRVNGLAT